MFQVSSFKAQALILFSLTFFFACTKPQDKQFHLEHNHAENETTYTCPMHPQIVQKEPGACPICGMDLVPVSVSKAAANEIMLGESQIKLANIITQKVDMSDIETNTVLAGKVVENKEFTEVISSRVAGRIERLHLKQTGLAIRKGQPLYDIYSEALLTYQKEFLLAQEQYQQVDSTSDRYASLLSSARKKLLLYGMTESQVNKLAESKNIEPKITFLSPVSGLISEITAAEGAYVAEGSPLYSIEQLDQVWVEADVYTGEAELVHIGDKVQVMVAGYKSKPVTGKVIFLSPEYRSGSQIITLRAEIDNPHQQFLPGMQADVILQHSTPKGIALPVDAVIRDENGSHVWIRTPEGTFTSKMVTLGTENFNRVEIEEGLKEGDDVVVSGAYLLYSEYILKKGGDPMAGHDH